MAVFTLPSFDVVFKLIKDRFPPSKRTTPEDVQRRYKLVFDRDKVGRLVDAQEFTNLSFDRDRFAAPPGGGRQRWNRTPPSPSRPPGLGKIQNRGWQELKLRSRGWMSDATGDGRT